MGFINGLNNSLFRKILNELKPQTLDKAFILIKKEETQECSQFNHINAINNTEKMFNCDCSSQIQSLLVRISQMEKQITFLQNKQPRNTFISKSQIKCFNCDSFGHIARFCKKIPVCRIVV